MAEKSPEERRKRASEYNVRTMLNKPRKRSDELRQAGMVIGLITALIGLVFLGVDRLLVTGLAVFLAGVAVTALSAFARLPGGKLRRMHIVNAADDSLRLDLEIRGQDVPLAYHAYELPAGARAVYSDSYEPDTEYAIVVTLEDGPAMRTAATPVRSTAGDDASEEFVVEIDGRRVRCREWTPDVDADGRGESSHELFLR